VRSSTLRFVEDGWHERQHDQVQTTLAAVGLAYVEVSKSHRRLFGWWSDGWDGTVVNYLAGLRSALETADS